MSRLRLFIEKSFYHMRLKPVGSAAGIILSTLCLAFAGAASILFWSMGQSMPAWMTGREAMVFLHDDVSAQDQARVVQEMKQWPEVLEVRPISGEAAWKELREQMHDWKDALVGVGNSPIRDSLRIELGPGDVGMGGDRALAEKIRQFPEVEAVYHGVIWSEKVQSLSTVVKIAGIGTVALFILFTVIVLFTVIKDTVVARQGEIEIYSVVGATPLFITAPFYVEGMLYGAVSAMISVGLLFLTGASLQRSMLFPAAFSWSSNNLLLLSVGLLGVGSASGCLGAWLALRWYCKIR